MIVSILNWLTRVFISIVGGAGVGCLTFAIVFMIGSPSSFHIQGLDSTHGPPIIPLVLSIGSGLVTMAFLSFLLFRGNLLRDRDSAVM